MDNPMTTSILTRTASLAGSARRAWRARVALGLLGACAASLALAVTSGATSAYSPHASRPRTSRHASGEMPASARQMYALTWGVDELTVKVAESGQLVRFSYRVTDADKA